MDSECRRYWFKSDFCHRKFNKFQETRFWKEKSVEDVITLGPMAQAALVYLWRKVVCFVCFVIMRSTQLGCFRSCSWCLWKALDKKGCMGSVPWHLDLRCKSFRFGNIWISNVEDIYFEVISTAENSNKFKKTRFWKEKSAENVVTLEGLPFNSSTISFHIGLFKKWIHTLQNNVHMPSFHIL